MYKMSESASSVGPVASNSQLSQLKEMLGQGPMKPTMGGRKRRHSRKCGGSKHTLGGRHKKHHKKHHKSRRHRKHH